MDKYKNEEVVPTRSDKNKELYKQIYNAYDNFENLVVPSNAREITKDDLKKEITSRSEYKRKKEYDEITNNTTNSIGTNNTIIRKEKIKEVQTVQLVDMQEKARQSGRPEDAQDINDMVNRCNRFERKIHDLEIQIHDR